MREERAQIPGDLMVHDSLTLWGNVMGSVTVTEAGRLYVRGTIYGDLDVQPGGRVHVYGSVQGQLTVGEKTKVIVSGLLGGNAVNNGGRLYFEKSAKIMGKVRERAGKTRYNTDETPAEGEKRRSRKHADDPPPRYRLDG